MTKQLGISPKIIADLIVTVGGYLLTKYGAGLDATTAALISKGLGTIAAYFTAPGTVITKATP
jgi:hypothetical protein